MADNIKRLMKLRWVSFFRTVLICIVVWMAVEVLASAGFLLFSVVRHTAQGVYVTSFRYFVMLGGAIVTIWCAYTQHRNDHLTMYPGNAWSRFLSGMLESHIMIVVVVLLSGFVYIVEALYYHLLDAAGLSVDASLSFSSEYMGYGMLQLVSLLLALYGILSFVSCVMGRLGLGVRKMVAVWIGIILIVVALCMLCYGITEWTRGFENVGNWMVNLFNKSSQIEFVLKLLGIWAFMLLCTACVTRTYRKWQKCNNAEMVFAGYRQCVRNNGV